MRTFFYIGFAAFCLSSCYDKTNNEESGKKPCEVASLCPEKHEYVMGYSYFSDDNGHRYFVGKNTATTLSIKFLKLRDTRSALPINYAKLLSSFKNKKDSLCCLKRIEMLNEYDIEDYLVNKDSIAMFLESLKDIHLQYFYLAGSMGANDFLQYLGNVDSIKISTCDTGTIDINAFLKTAKGVRYFNYLYSCSSLEWDKNPIGYSIRKKILFDTTVAKLNPNLEFVRINVVYPEDYFFKNGEILSVEISR